MSTGVSPAPIATLSVRASSTNLSFTPINGMCCVDGPEDVVTLGLERIAAPNSPLSAMYEGVESSPESCKERGYTNYAKDEPCFTGGGLWLDDDPKHTALLKTAEIEAETAYRAEHNMTMVEMMQTMQEEVCF